jgi:hypothetical protein
VTKLFLTDIDAPEYKELIIETYPPRTQDIAELRDLHVNELLADKASLAFTEDDTDNDDPTRRKLDTDMADPK